MKFPVQTEQPWFNAGELPPDSYQSVIVWAIATIDKHYRAHEAYRDRKGRWHSVRTSTQFSHVSHWRKMPHPPNDAPLNRGFLESRQ
jgi:hypothetical protein